MINVNCSVVPLAARIQRILQELMTKLKPIILLDDENQSSKFADTKPGSLNYQSQPPVEIPCGELIQEKILIVVWDWCDNSRRIE